MEKNHPARCGLAFLVVIIALLASLVTMSPPISADDGHSDPRIPTDIAQPGQIVKCRVERPPITLPPPWGSGSSDEPAARGCADLVITMLEINRATCSADVTVANEGPVDAGTFQFSGASAIKSFAGLEASTTVSFTLEDLRFAGATSLFVVDSANQVLESNETNNSRQIKIPNECQHLRCDRIVVSRLWADHILQVDSTGVVVADLGSVLDDWSSFRALEHANGSLIGATVDALWQIDPPSGTVQQVAPLQGVLGLGQDLDGALLAIGEDLVLHRVDPAAGFSITEIGRIEFPDDDMAVTSLVVLPDGQILLFAWNRNPGEPGHLVLVDRSSGSLIPSPVGGPIEAWTQSMVWFEDAVVMFGSDHSVIHVNPDTFSVFYRGEYSHEQEFHGATAARCDPPPGNGLG